MELTEVVNACVALRSRIGVSQADVSVVIGADASVLLYPNGLLKRAIHIHAGADDTFASLFAKASAAWDAHVDQHRSETVRAMALAIIEITAAYGRCSDAALRMKFPADEIRRHGAEAIKDANEIAANGPFSIDMIGGANGAPREEEAA